MAAATRGTGARPTPHGKIRLAENEIWDFVNGIILAENYIMYIYGFLYKLHEFMGFMCCSYLYIYMYMVAFGMFDILENIRAYTTNYHFICMPSH